MKQPKRYSPFQVVVLWAVLIGPSQGQEQSSLRDVLSSAEAKTTKAIERTVSDRLQELQKQAHVKVMGRLNASERNSELACTLAWTGVLKEQEGNTAGVVSFVSADPQNDSSLQQLVKFPEWKMKGEYSFSRFDVAAWPMRDEAHKGQFAVRIEMRPGRYWDFADSQGTDYLLHKDWWRPLVAPHCANPGHPIFSTNSLHSHHFPGF
jgi:hypothetical protein